MCDGSCSLLDLLADRKDKAGKTGKVLINGQRRQPNYKNMVGYVVQVRRRGQDGGGGVGGEREGGDGREKRGEKGGLEGRVV